MGGVCASATLVATPGRAQEDEPSGVQRAIRLGLATSVFQETTTSSDGDTEVEVASSSFGIPGGAQLLLGYAPIAQFNFGTSLGLRSETNEVTVDDEKVVEINTAAVIWGVFIEGMAAEGVVRPYGRLLAALGSGESTINDQQGEDVSSADFWAGAGIHIFPAESISFDLGIDLVFGSVDYGGQETSGIGVIGTFGLTGWLSASKAKPSLQESDASRFEQTSAASEQRALPEPEPAEDSAGTLRLQLPGGVRLFAEPTTGDAVRLTLVLPASSGCSELHYFVDEQQTALPDVQAGTVQLGSSSRPSFQGAVERDALRTLSKQGAEVPVGFGACDDSYFLGPGHRRQIREFLVRTSN